jgi:hypothetical protein
METMFKSKLIIALIATMLLGGRPYAQTYNYKDVQIRGGGFVTGLIFNPSRQNLLYARTDVGGAYKWNPGTNSWTPLTDHLGSAEQNYTGVLSLATDPIDTNRVYLATGLYTQSWAGNGAVLRSSDRGATWSKTDLSIKLGGNEDGRSAGEMLQVDPNLNSILYMGTSVNGLWKSTDYGATWAQVGSFPAATARIAFVQFKKNSGSTGSATPVIYVGLLQTGTNLYRSTDGGVTWAAVPGAPTSITVSSVVYNLMPHQAALSTSDILYLAYSDNTGPNNIQQGAIYKYNIGTSTWTRIDNTAGITYTQGGYASIAVDANAPNTIMVSTMDRWWPQDAIYRSTDGGSNWTEKLVAGTRSETSAPWVTTSTPHWIGDIEIDPFVSGNAWFVTGYGVYQSANITAGSPTWTYTSTGLEEIVTLGLISPPTGAPLISAVGDQDGFVHTNLDASPAAGKFAASYGTSSSIDFAQNNPNYIARTHFSAGGNMGAYSTNQGVSWTSFGSYPSSGNGGVIAIAADASRMVWAPDGGAAVSYSTNNGNTWTASTGINTGIDPVADRVNSNKFYAYDAANGNVLASTNGGVSFSTTATGFNAVPSWLLWAAGINAVFGIEGDIWLHNPDGLFHSVNSGASFTQIANVGTTYKVAFGKSQTTGGYPAVYIVGTVGGVYGFYRSDNTGSTWTRINDNNHQYGGINALAADANIYGRVYLGTAGRGIIYGDINATLPAALVSFTATLVNRGGGAFAHLQWQTTPDATVSQFFVEKSLNGMNWMRAGNMNSVQSFTSYQYDDDISGAYETVFYRLAMVEINGSVSYSAVVAVKKENRAAGIFVSAWPNPVTSGTFRLNVHTDKSMTVIIRLSDIHGHEIYKSNKINIQEGDNKIPVTALQHNPRGMYAVEIYSADAGSIIGSLMIVSH